MKLPHRIVMLLLALTGAACSGGSARLDVTAPPSTGPATAPAVATDAASSTTIAGAEAEAQILYAFSMIANTKATQAERDAAMEDGEQTSADRAARFEKYRTQAAGVVFLVDAIRFVSATQAEVDFHIQAIGGEPSSPSRTNVLHGGAVVQGGHWRVSKATSCVLAALAGNVCPN